MAGMLTGKVFIDYFKSSDAVAKVARLQDLNQFVAALRINSKPADVVKVLHTEYTALLAKRVKNVEDRIVQIRIGLKLGRYLKLLGYLHEAISVLMMAYKLRRKSDGSDVTELALVVTTEESIFGRGLLVSTRRNSLAGNSCYMAQPALAALSRKLAFETKIAEFGRQLAKIKQNRKKFCYNLILICAANHAYDVEIAAKFVDIGDALLSSTSHVMREAEMSFRTEKAVFLLDTGKQEQAYALINSVLRSMTELSPSNYSCVEVLYHAAKICRRQALFELASNFLQASARLSAEFYEHSSVVMTLILGEVSWLLHDCDLYESAISVQKSVVQRREKELGQQNALAGIAFTDLACFEYVMACNSNEFKEAMKCADEAIKNLQSAGDVNYAVLRARALRQKAIITRTMTQTVEDENERGKMLNEAQQLALQCKDLCTAKVGESHFQTAACYSFLGDNLAAMGRLPEAEKMHVKATKLLANALGPNHQNYANALNNLASLYNFNMQAFDKAEPLYKTVINIYSQTIGPTCTNLQYPYRGLAFLYSSTGKVDLAAQYDAAFNQWQTMREQKKSDKQEIQHLVTLLASDMSKQMKMEEALDRFLRFAPKPVYKEKEKEVEKF